jgi:tryptophanyl-tRNA synthetase
MSLDDAGKKMSKSNPNPGSFIALLDPPDVVRKKISRATTDSGREVKYDPANKPEVSNLLGIYSHCAGMSIEEIEAKYEGQGYGAFKKELAEAVVSVLEPLQTKYNEIRSSGAIHDILKQGAEKASVVADKTLADAKELMGFLAPKK